VFTSEQGLLDTAYITVSMVFVCSWSGRLEDAIAAYTEAIKNNPCSALMYAKRARSVCLTCFTYVRLPITVWSHILQKRTCWN